MQSEIDRLRIAAFKSNSEADKRAYLEALSLAYQRGDLVPAACSPVPDDVAGLASRIASDAFKHMPRYGWTSLTTDEVHGAIQIAALSALATIDTALGEIGE